jgi:hypothetical protein
MDNISIYLNSISYHETYIHIVMDMLQKYHLSLNDWKNIFRYTTTEFVEFGVDASGIRLLEEKNS